MKLAVIFLTTFVVGSLSQYHRFQQQRWQQPWLPTYHPTKSYFNSNPFFKYFPYYDNAQEDADFNPAFLMSDAFNDAETRGAFRPFARPQNQLPADERLFGLLGGGGGITITSKSTGMMKTKTLASLVQTLITSTQTIYCIPSAQVVSGAAVCSAAGRRRRREIALLNDMIEEAKRQHEEKERFLRSVIAPNTVEKLTTTEAPSLDSGRDAAINTELDSSQFNDDESDADVQRNKRNFFGLFQMTTQLAITNCSTTVTTTTIQLNLSGVSGSGSAPGSSANTAIIISSIACLPSGLSTCSAAASSG